MSEPRQRPRLRALPAPEDGWKILLKKEVLCF